MSKAKRLSTLALLISCAMILSYVESLFPPIVPLPGVKIGLANIAIVFALYFLGIKEATIVSLVRVALASLLFGSYLSAVYSLAGAILALTLMSLLKSFSSLTALGVSVAGGVAHNIGQILAAALILHSSAVFYYLPYLLISGTAAGSVIGIAGGILTRRISSLGLSNKN